MSTDNRLQFTFFQRRYGTRRHVPQQTLAVTEIHIIFNGQELAWRRVNLRIRELVLLVFRSCIRNIHRSADSALAPALLQVVGHLC